MLSTAERAVLNSALEKYQPGQSVPHFSRRRQPVQTGIAADDGVSLEDRAGQWRRGGNELHPVGGGRAGQGRKSAFTPRFKRISLQSKKRLGAFRWSGFGKSWG
jgi:hypothetical protein